MSQNLIMELPTEILQNIFECVVLSPPKYVRILLSLSLVCHRWKTIISTTPRLWAIFRIHRGSRIKALDIQITNAKSAMLDVSVMPDCIGDLASHLRAVMKRLLKRSENFVSLTAGTDAFASYSNWRDFKALQYLELSMSRTPYPRDPRKFFSCKSDNAVLPPSSLETFIAYDLSDSWTRGFLSSSIKHIHLIGQEPLPEMGLGNVWSILEDDDDNIPHDIQNTFDYLSMVPRLVTLKLKNIKHPSPSQARIPSIILKHLESITLDHVLEQSSVLSAIHAPSLKELTVIKGAPYKLSFQGTPPLNYALSFSNVFTQWSQPGAIPRSLHTLKLIRVLRLPDVPFLIRWLAYLPSLTHLTLKGNVVGRAARAAPNLDVSGEANLFRALASPTWCEPSQSTTGWLCPSLTHLYLDVGEVVGDLLPIARARGGKVEPSPHGVGVKPPARLRMIQAKTLCKTGTWDEQQLLLRLADDISCRCLVCCIRDLNG